MTAPGRKYGAIWGLLALVGLLGGALIVGVGCGWLTAEEARALGEPLRALALMLGGSYAAAAAANGAEHLAQRRRSTLPAEAPPAAPDPEGES